MTSLSFLAILKVGYFVDRCVVPLRGCGAATVTLDRAERAMVMAMAKNRVHLKIGGSAYTVLTDDAPEYVEELAEELDKEMRSIINENPSLSVTQAAVLTALDKADTCKKSTASSDNLRAQIKDYLEDSARARMEVDVARREIERLNREIRRRTRVVGTFPDGNSALMLVCARLRHVAGTQWGNKKYMNMKHLEAALDDASIAG
mgnify:CR=1 FL=1